VYFKPRRKNPFPFLPVSVKIGHLKYYNPLTGMVKELLLSGNVLLF
jgi:hypothetical protein